MNFTKYANSVGNFRFLCIFSLLTLAWASACSPVAASSVPVEIQKTAIAMPASATIESTIVPTDLPTATPEPELIYPYYLSLATKLDNVSQTINGVTARIDWAYVDESRVAIQYTISGLDWTDGSLLDGMQQVQMSIPAISNFKFGGFSGASGGNMNPSQNGEIIGSSDQSLLDGALDAEKYPNINVKVNIPVEGPTKIGTFHINFTVPVLNGIKMENIDQTVVANDVSMTLKTLVVNPSYVEALFCFQMPSAQDWGLTSIKLTMSGREYSYSGGGLLLGSGAKAFALTDPERCSSIGFNVLYDSSVSTVTFNIPKLLVSMPEVVDHARVMRANERLADRGIEIDYANVDHGGNIVILKRPAGATDQEIYPLIWEALSEQYEGPWAFTVEIAK